MARGAVHPSGVCHRALRLCSGWIGWWGNSLRGRADEAANIQENERPLKAHPLSLLSLFILYSFFFLSFPSPWRSREPLARTVCSGGYEACSIGRVICRAATDTGCEPSLLPSARRSVISHIGEREMLSPEGESFRREKEPSTLVCWRSINIDVPTTEPVATVTTGVRISGKHILLFVIGHVLPKLTAEMTQKSPAHPVCQHVPSTSSAMQVRAKILRGTVFLGAATRN